MADSRKHSKPRRAPATSPESRENQVIAAAVDLAEKQIREGTASAQVITHFLKMGSPREQLERDRLRGEIKLSESKIKELESRANIEELYGAAIDAMRAYSGAREPSDD